MIYTESVSFDWDEKKFLSNLKKHGIDFRDAVLVFYDFKAIIEVDSKHSTHELRYKMIGYSPQGLLFVVFTKKSPTIMRLITTRKCNKKEKLRYGQKNKIFID